MPSADPPSQRPLTGTGGGGEAAIWERAGRGWRQLEGSFRDLGFSVEWHEFAAGPEIDWAPSFHADGVEICLNLLGRGEVTAGTRRLELGPETAGFYCQAGRALAGRRLGGEPHRFLTVELSARFLRLHLGPKESGVAPIVRDFLEGRNAPAVSEPIRLSLEHQQLIKSLHRPPVAAAGQRMWFLAKALELTAAFLYQPGGGGELFCHRHHRQNHERVQKVIALLRAHLAESISLEEIGRRAGCSPFYLSRIFSQETGRTIFQYLRGLRMERAAQLLEEKKLSVTEVALEVGYQSPSHFSSAFHETYGCCPGLYPLRTLGAAGRPRGPGGGGLASGR